MLLSRFMVNLRQGSLQSYVSVGSADSLEDIVAVKLSGSICIHATVLQIVSRLAVNTVTSNG